MAVVVVLLPPCLCWGAARPRENKTDRARRLRFLEITMVVDYGGDEILRDSQEFFPCKYNGMTALEIFLD